LTRLPDANRYPLRAKTPWRLTGISSLQKEPRTLFQGRRQNLKERIVGAIQPQRRH
jgi:hypothetical protein